MLNLPQAGQYAMIVADQKKLHRIDALELGKAAEHLVCADLILSGHKAYLSDQGLPYDVVADVDGRLIRIQVKGSCYAKNVNVAGRSANYVYRFHARRRGKGQKGERLSDRHCEVVAFVALDIRAVAYFALSEVAQTVSLYPPGYTFPGKYKRNRFAAIDGFPFSKVILPC